MAPADLKTLYEILVAEKDVYAELLDTAVRKAGAVVKGDLEDLRQLIDLEAATEGKKQQIATQRAQASAAVAQSLGLTPDDATLRNMIARMPAHEADAMEVLRAAFSLILCDLTAQNETNAKLIRAQLNAIGISIERAAQTRLMGNQYDSNGGAADTTHRVSILDTTV